MAETLAVLPRLEPGSILLHIGPFKTGSTAIQSALFARREELGTHGVEYPGTWRRVFTQGHALLRWAPRGRELPPVEVWDEFAATVRDLADSGRTVCLSTEDFGRINEREHSAKIVADLGADRLHVLAAVRAYHRLMPSHWQERVKSHEELGFDDWLRLILEGPDDDGVKQAFWMSHDVEWMASRWRGLIAPEQFTFVVSDDTDRRVLPRVFEQLLGLPEDFLVTARGLNESLSYNATEMLRSLNGEFVRRGWDDRTYTDLVQRGVTKALQEAGRTPSEVALPRLPLWAKPLVEERSRRRVAALHASQARIVGDPAALMPPPADGATVPVVETIPVQSAAVAVAGAIDAALRDLAKAEARVARQRPGVDLDTVGGRHLVRALARRVRRRLTPGS